MKSAIADFINGCKQNHRMTTGVKFLRRQPARISFESAALMVYTR